jgi:hypothetical protein
MVSPGQSGGVEPRRAVAVLRTLVRHAAAAGHYLYRMAMVVALLAGTAGGPVVGNPALASTTTALADGGTVSFPDGVSVTVAPGWTIYKQWIPGFWANDNANTAQIQVTSGNAPHAPDIKGDMAFMINDDINAEPLTNVVQSPDPSGVQSVQGKNFTQELLVGYTADVQTDQGTVQLTGVWIQLFNPSTKLDGFIDVFAQNSGDLQQAIPDAKTMIASML